MGYGVMCRSEGDEIMLRYYNGVALQTPVPLALSICNQYRIRAERDVECPGKASLGVANSKEDVVHQIIDQRS